MRNTIKIEALLVQLNCCINAFGEGNCLPTLTMEEINGEIYNEFVWDDSECTSTNLDKPSVIKQKLQECFDTLFSYSTSYSCIRDLLSVNEHHSNYKKIFSHVEAELVLYCERWPGTVKYYDQGFVKFNHSGGAFFHLESDSGEILLYFYFSGP